MKKRLALSLLAVLTCASIAVADIQSPPGHMFNWSRKLSRGIANIAYGPLEILSYWSRSNRTDGSVAASVVGPIEGVKRAVIRAGYGVFEVVTFPAPAYKGTFRPATYRKQRVDPWFGYDEFAPQLGVSTQASYSRTQTW